MLWSLNKFSQIIFQGNAWAVWRIYMWILGLKRSSLVWSETVGRDSRDPAKLCTQMFLCGEFITPSEKGCFKEMARMGSLRVTICFMIYTHWYTTTAFFKAENLWNRLHWSSWYGKQSNQRCPAFRLFTMGWKNSTRSQPRQVKFPVRSRQESGCLVPSSKWPRSLAWGWSW